MFHIQIKICIACATSALCRLKVTFSIKKQYFFTLSIFLSILNFINAHPLIAKKAPLGSQEDVTKNRAKHKHFPGTL